MSERRSWRWFLSWRPWLYSLALWLTLMVLEQLPAYEVGERGELQWIGLQWQWFMRRLPWYVPAVPLTVLMAFWAPRIVALPRFWRAFAVAVLGASLISSLWMGLVQSYWSWLGIGWIVHHLPRFAAVFGLLIVYEQMRLKERNRRELVATQLRALRAQLQPHFLFNTLHAIGVTAKSDGPAAARMTTLLGDLLRQTLRERDGGLVSLAEERELLQPYVQLQQLRFGDRLRVDFDAQADVLAAAVPDLVLQPLVENALRHGIEQRPGDGRVRVQARRDGAWLVLEVQDDGAGLSDGEPVAGTGLGATRARLQALYGEGASLTLCANDDGGTTATLRLPFREVAHAA